MPATPQVDALPGMTPLGVKPAADPEAAPYNIRGTLQVLHDILVLARARSDGLAPSADCATLQGHLENALRLVDGCAKQIAESRNKTGNQWQGRAMCQGYKGKKLRDMEVEFFVGALTARCDALGEEPDVGWAIAIMSGRPIATFHRVRS